MSAQTTESNFLKILKFTLKAIALVVIFGTSVFFLWRVFSSGNPKELERLTPNDALCEAYAAAEAEGRELSVYTQFQENTITSVLNKNYGYFAITDAKFIEDADQIQILFRYNNSTIRHLVEDYDLPETPDRDEQLYDVTLYVAYDLTPDNGDDNLGNDPASVKFVRYYATEVISDRKNLYNYRKLIFDGIDLTVEDTPILAIYVDFYYVGDLDYDKDSYGTLPIYDYITVKDPYELSRAERKSLGE